MHNKIRELRASKGITQEQLSQITGVNRVSIARYELGEVQPSLKNAQKIAAAFGCTIDELLTRRDTDDKAV